MFPKTNGMKFQNQIMFLYLIATLNFKTLYNYNTTGNITQKYIKSHAKKSDLEYFYIY